MPIHDWTLAPSDYFHHFHQYWSVAICTALNGGILPKGIFALVEQHTGALVPDVLALESRSSNRYDWSTGNGGTAVLTEPPKTRFISRAMEEAAYAAKANRVTVRRSEPEGDETVAVIEIVSPGNKSGTRALADFVDKSLAYLDQGINLLVIDLFPPSPRDPRGIHGAIWGEVSDEAFGLPADKPLTLASYVAVARKTAYVETVAVNDGFPAMPVFLNSRAYVRVPLEETYEATWKLCPAEFREKVARRTEPVA